VGGRAAGACAGCATDRRNGDCVPSIGWEMPMTAMDLLGLMLIVFLVAPMVTARPSRF
jgi:hypothetical protein